MIRPRPGPRPSSTRLALTLICPGMSGRLWRIRLRFTVAVAVAAPGRRRGRSRRNPIRSISSLGRVGSIPVAVVAALVPAKGAGREVSRPVFANGAISPRTRRRSEVAVLIPASRWFRAILAVGTVLTRGVAPPVHPLIVAWPGTRRDLIPVTVAATTAAGRVVIRVRPITGRDIRTPAISPVVARTDFAAIRPILRPGAWTLVVVGSVIDRVVGTRSISRVRAGTIAVTWTGMTRGIGSGPRVGTGLTVSAGPRAVVPRPVVPRPVAPRPVIPRSTRTLLLPLAARRL